MDLHLTSEIIDGFTHLYEDKICNDENKAARRCDTTKKAKVSVLKKTSEEDLQKLIHRGKVCYTCLRYKTGLIVD